MLDHHQSSSLENLPTQLQSLREQIQIMSQGFAGDPLALLALLRTLESLHQEIRDSLFQETLPNNRQALYHLLREIESQGGWPYIPRMSLRSLQEKILDQSSEPENPKP